MGKKSVKNQDWLEKCNIERMLALNRPIKDFWQQDTEIYPFERNTHNFKQTYKKN